MRKRDAEAELEAALKTLPEPEPLSKRPLMTDGEYKVALAAARSLHQASRQKLS